MPEKIIMPRMGMTMETGFVTKWYKKEGESVKAGEPIVEIMTDKANMDIEAESNGVIYKILVEEGNEVPVGNVIGIIKNEQDTEEDLKKILKELSNGQQSNTLSEPEATIEEKRPKSSLEQSDENYKAATPYAKKLAKKYGINLKEMSSNKAITSKEIFEKSKHQTNAFSNPVQKAMAQRMTESAKIPQFTLYFNFRVSDLLKSLNDFKVNFPKVTLTVFIVKALSLAMEKFPVFKSQYENNTIKTSAHANIGVAIATENGLFVPTLKDVESKSLPEVAGELALLRQKALNGTLDITDMSNASITVSNMGMFGVDMFRALLVPGQSAILAVSAIEDKVTVKNGGIFIEKVMNISISCDHRFVDGATAARFMNEIKSILENKYGEILKWE
jgi:pyruvate dehydrogenase E2 component (dihydrolipoamide acetyltransferase)